MHRSLISDHRIVKRHGYPGVTVAENKFERTFLIAVKFNQVLWISYEGLTADALASVGDEGRGKLR